MIYKTPYEEFFRYHDFTAWLNTDETITNVSVKAYLGAEEQQNMISDAGAYDSKKVIYFLKGGVSGKQYKIKNQVITSNGQKFEVSVMVAVI